MIFFTVPLLRTKYPSIQVFAARNCCAIVAKKWFPLFTPNNSIFRSVRGNQSQTMLP